MSDSNKAIWVSGHPSGGEWVKHHNPEFTPNEGKYLVKMKVGQVKKGPNWCEHCKVNHWAKTVCPYKGKGVPAKVETKPEEEFVAKPEENYPTAEQVSKFKADWGKVGKDILSLLETGEILPGMKIYDELADLPPGKEHTWTAVSKVLNAGVAQGILNHDHDGYWLTPPAPDPESTDKKPEKRLVHELTNLEGLTPDDKENWDDGSLGAKLLEFLHVGESLTVNEAL